jgi:hypothetical protein
VRYFLIAAHLKDTGTFLCSTLAWHFCLLIKVGQSNAVYAISEQISYLFLEQNKLFSNDHSGAQ